MRRRFESLLASFCLVSCASAGPEIAPTPESQAFFAALETLCTDAAYRGQLVSNDADDADFKTADIVMGPAQCAPGRIEIPLAVDDDRSRIWQITQTESGLRLKHDHTHADGSKDKITQYGGDSPNAGTAERQIFPVDAETERVFTEQGIPVSIQNTWAVEIRPNRQFVYEMWRPNRQFRLEFDLAETAPAPPPPWAVAPVK